MAEKLNLQNKTIIGEALCFIFTLAPLYPYISLRHTYICMYLYMYYLYAKCGCKLAIYVLIKY